MAFGSNDFPLGPNNQYPRQRIRNFGNMVAPPNRVEDVYRDNNQVQLPVVEKEYNSSVEKVKRRMKFGREMRKGQRPDKFRPKNIKQLKMEESEDGLGRMKWSDKFFIKGRRK